MFKFLTDDFPCFMASMRKVLILYIIVTYSGEVIKKPKNRGYFISKFGEVGSVPVTPWLYVILIAVSIVNHHLLKF